MDNGTANWRESEGKKVLPISLYHIWRLRMETRRLATESGRRMGVVRRFIYNQRRASATPVPRPQCSQPRPAPLPHAAYARRLRAIASPVSGANGGRDTTRLDLFGIINRGVTAHCYSRVPDP